MLLGANGTLIAWCRDSYERSDMIGQKDERHQTDCTTKTRADGDSR